MMTSHGISAGSFEAFSTLDPGEADRPVRVSDESIWVMIESHYPLVLTSYGAMASSRDKDYRRSYFQPVPRRFTGPKQGQASKL